MLGRGAAPGARRHPARLDRGLAQDVFLIVFVALMFTIATVLQLPGKARQGQAQAVS